MLKLKYNNNIKKIVKKNKIKPKFKTALVRFSFFYSLLKLRKKTYLTIKDRFNKFKLIKFIKSKKSKKNLILKTLTYKNIKNIKNNKDNDYFSNLKDTYYFYHRNMLKVYKNKSKQEEPKASDTKIFNNIYIRSKIFYKVYKAKPKDNNDILKYYKKFWFLKFLFNWKILNLQVLHSNFKNFSFNNKNFYLKFFLNLKKYSTFY